LGADGDMGVLFGENEDDAADDLVMNGQFVVLHYRYRVSSWEVRKCCVDRNIKGTYNDVVRFEFLWFAFEP